MLAWVPDTGSDVDAIGLNRLDQLGRFPENLSVDENIVTGANGQELWSLRKIDTTLQLDETTHGTNVHVYDELIDALFISAHTDSPRCTSFRLATCDAGPASCVAIRTAPGRQ